MPEDKPLLLTCIYCGDLIDTTAVNTIVTKASLDENGQPDFDKPNTLEGVAHTDCWEREQPTQAQA